MKARCIAVPANRYSYTLFHLSFALASMYIGMLLIRCQVRPGAYVSPMATP